MYPRIALVMERMRSALLALRTDRSGVTAIEYALIIGLISIFTIAWATFVGGKIVGFFTSVNNGF